MKIKILKACMAVMLFLLPNLDFGQAPNLGTASGFVVFSSIGAVTNSGITYLTKLTGHVGTNSGAISGFGNVDGNMYAGGPESAQCAVDLLLAYNQLNATVPTFFPAPLLGNGQILIPGVYSISSPAVLNSDLILNAQGNQNAVFIFQIQGAFSANANSKIKLINGAKACNVFWKVEGLVDLAAGTFMKGTIVANNAAINMSAGDTLEGRALATNGAITLDQILGYTPIGCGSPVLTGPSSPTLASIECYGLFSSDGPVSNVGITTVTGDIGSNNGSALGYLPLLVTGMIHPIPDISTSQCATDLGIVYTYLNTLPNDILLLYPAQFGNNLVLTPHTYLMNGATTLIDSLYLNAQGNANAVFVIQINGALGTSVNSKIILINGAQSKNVFWKVDGAVSINDNSIFRGTIICNNGAISLNTGVLLEGRALTTTGALSTSAITVAIPKGVGVNSQPVDQTVCAGNSASFSVVASGNVLTYQWRKGIVNITNGGNISGATSPTLVINPASISDASANYNVVISGSCFQKDSSVNVSLVVNAAPIIISPPANQSVCSGGSVNFSVTSSGTGLTYQWRKGIVNINNGGNISGSTSPTLTINPANGADVAANYNVVIMGLCAPNRTSNNVALTLNDPIITSQPNDQIACPGNSVTIAVTATGLGLSYQWRKGIMNLVNGGNISGVNTSILTFSNLTVSDISNNYNLVITGSCLPAINSNTVSVNVNSLSISTEPSDQIACNGNSVSFIAIISGTASAYQWRKGMINLINGGNISGATSTILTINPTSISDVASDYDLIVMGSCALNDTSINVSLSFYPTLIANATSATSVCTGAAINLLAQTVSGCTYSWSGPNGYTSTLQNPVIISSSLNNAGTYTLLVSKNTCVSAPSIVNVTVNDCIEFFIPEGFSPNGDGINDEFFIRGIERFTENTLVIFNRWGDKVFDANPYQNTWKGKATLGTRIGGDELPVGVYFYVLDLGDGTPFYKGTIYLNR